MYSLNESLEDFPEHVLLDILSRLPAKTIIHCKCVCKNWRDLVSDSHFANLHLSKVPAGIMLLQCSHDGDLYYPEHDIQYFEYDVPVKPKPYIFKSVEIEDEHDHHSLHHDPIMSLDLNFAPILQNSYIHTVGSINGFVCLLSSGWTRENIFICNPITREYVILPEPQFVAKGPASIAYGFGVSSLTREYKVIRTFRDFEWSHPLPVETEVYTLGTGQWKSLDPTAYSIDGNSGAILNNHLHWIIPEIDGSPERIYAFDLDREVFRLFPSPPENFEENIEENIDYTESLGVLKGCLCHAYCSFYDVSIWMMKEYGIKKSWQKEVFITRSISPALGWPFQASSNLIQSLKDGSIMMVSDYQRLLIYRPDTDTTEGTEFSDYFLDAVTYCPSFLKIQNFEPERVQML